MMLEDEVLELDVNELVYDYQNYGVRTAVKYGLCKAIKTAYNHFMISFVDSYNGISLKTAVVDSSNCNIVIVDPDEFTEILEEEYYSSAPATNSEVGVALLNAINAVFIECVDYVDNYYCNF